MNISHFIARRYLFAKQNTQVITVISRIAMGGIGVGAFALVVVLSAFNGLENLVSSLYSNFDPDIKITATNSKFIDKNSFDFEQLESVNGIKEYEISLEEIGMVKYRDKQMFAKIKGVESRFLELARVDSNMYEGTCLLKRDEKNYALLGYGISYELDFFMSHLNRPLVVYAARSDIKNFQNPQNAFRTASISPAGVFAINPDVDKEYVLVPLEFAESIFNKEEKLTQIEIWVQHENQLENIADELADAYGSDYTVKTRFQLNEIIYKTNQSEKWITFFILFFILLIATFNLIGSVTLLLIEKKKDIQVMRSYGTPFQLVKNIFIRKGVYLASLGGFIGIVLGIITVILQEQIGLIPLEGSIVPYYPVALEYGDILVISASVLLLSSLGAFLPVNYLLDKYYHAASEL